jgi:hypothetical protein
MIKNTPSRRTILRSAGLSLGLPFLPSLARADKISDDRSVASENPFRLIAIGSTLGFHLPNIVPEQAGEDYTASRYLKLIERHRQSFTFVSGLSHTDVDGGHNGEKSFLNGSPHPGSASYRPTQSLDQLHADVNGSTTRIKSLVMRTNRDTGQHMSYDVFGQVVPPHEDPVKIFSSMFMADGQDHQNAILTQLQRDQSVLDHVIVDVKKLQSTVNSDDRQRLDEFYTSLRSVEKDIHRNLDWAKRDKPRTDYPFPKKLPQEAELTVRQRLLLDISALAFRTDSTRSISLRVIGSGARVPLEGVKESYHGLTHHGLDEDKIAQLAIVEGEIITAVGLFLDQLKEARDADGRCLLDRTIVLLGSGLGNANSHSNRDLPILIAGGGFRHGQHLSYMNQDRRPPLCNLFVDIAQRLGIERDQFGSSTGTLFEKS